MMISKQTKNFMSLCFFVHQICRQQFFNYWSCTLECSKYVSTCLVIRVILLVYGIATIAYVYIWLLQVSTNHIGWSSGFTTDAHATLLLLWYLALVIIMIVSLSGRSARNYTEQRVTERLLWVVCATVNGVPLQSDNQDRVQLSLSFINPNNRLRCSGDAWCWGMEGWRGDDHKSELGSAFSSEQQGQPDKRKVSLITGYTLIFN